MHRSTLDALRHSLIAAQCSSDPALRELALDRYELAENAIARVPDRICCALLREELFEMLPSDWPLWIERERAFSAARAH